MKEYSPAPEVEQIAERLIQLVKPELEGFSIRYIFATENPVKDGREVAGLCRKIVGLNAYLAGDAGGFFLIETGLPAWEAMTAAQRIAYVHHELCHPGVSDEGGLYLIPHDIEEFEEIAEHWGDEFQNIASFAAAFERGQKSVDKRRERINAILER